MAFMPDDPRLPELFRQKFEINETTGCWEWTAYKDRDGYGSWSYGRKLTGTIFAHRAVFLLVGETIPEGWVMDHLCRNRGCVNPGHLEAVTSRENSLRGETVAAANAAKTHCNAGHELSGDNIRPGFGGTLRVCIGCQKGHKARSTERARAKKIAARRELVSA